MPMRNFRRNVQKANATIMRKMKLCCANLENALRRFGFVGKPTRPRSAKSTPGRIKSLFKRSIEIRGCKSKRFLKAKFNILGTNVKLQAHVSTNENSVKYSASAATENSKLKVSGSKTFGKYWRFSK